MDLVLTQKFGPHEKAKTIVYVKAEFRGISKSSFLYQIFIFE